MKTRADVEQAIKANERHLKCRRADLKKHTTDQCSCPNHIHTYRCEGHQRAIKSVISTLIQRQFRLRQERLK